jgi:8-oxo-dGTP diphosphatase
MKMSTQDYLNRERQIYYKEYVTKPNFELKLERTV